MPLSVQDLAWLSKNLHYRLSPSLEACRHPRQVSSILTAETLEDLNYLFKELATTPVTTDLLAKTRIHDALSEMAEPGCGWPDAFGERAERVLERWKAELGDLWDVGQKLWQGRMKGCVKVVVQGVGGRSVAGSADDLSEKGATRSAWVIEGAKERGFALSTGDLGFNVGAWWVKPAAALRDGIIHWTECGVSADDEEAFAVFMTGNEELESSHTHIKYRPAPEPSRKKLLRNAVTGNPVRVLRYYKLESKFSPEGGLRYDGLYNVKGWGVKLVRDAAYQDLWQYTFTLERCKHQASFEKALLHPDVEEKDDWLGYQKGKYERVKALPEIDPREDIMVAWSSKNSSRFGSFWNGGLLLESPRARDACSSEDTEEE